jgi:hypothetical protein
MSTLSYCLQGLFEFLASRDLIPPTRDVRFVDVQPDTRLDEQGRLQISLDALKGLEEYAGRFDELEKYGLPWINMSCYGVHQDRLIIGIEVPRQTRGEGESRPLALNYSGPHNSVLQDNWDIRSVVIID